MTLEPRTPCTRHDGRPKRRYSKRGAKLAVKKRNTRLGGCAEHYRCPSCGFWHLTTVR